MAGEIPDLHATVRTGTGKGPPAKLAATGTYLALYSAATSIRSPINIPFNVLLKKLKEGRFKSTLFNMKVDGHDDVRVICRDVQRDVVKDLPTHVDFMRLRRTTKINLFIPVEFIGEENAPGLKRGGVMTIVRPEVELIVTAGDIPEKITIDVSTADIGDTLTISQVELPAGAKPTIDRDFVIANIQAPSGLKSAGDDADGDAEGGDDTATEGGEE